MTPEEAVKAVETLQHVADVALLHLDPNDVIVIESANPLDSETIDGIGSYITQMFPRHRVLILDAGMKVKALRA